MNREDLVEIIEEQADEVVQLFKHKNKDYGDDVDAFYNFRETARRIYDLGDHEDMLKVLMTYMDKHLVAITNSLMNTSEYEERFRDIIVYSLIAIAIKKDEEAMERLKKQVFGSDVV